MMIARSILAIASMVLMSLWIGFPGELAAQQQSGWEHIGAQNGVRVSRMSVEGSDVLAFRGEIVADVHIAKLFAIFIDPQQRRHWLDRYADHRTLERDATSETYWLKFSLPFPVSDRDYVLDSRVQVDSARRVIVTHINSTTHPEAPEDKCCVRAETYKTYYRFEALQGSPARTRLTVEVHTNPKGMIPTWLVNRIQRDWPSTTLSNLIRHTQRWPVEPTQAMKNWHQPARVPADMPVISAD